MSVPTVQATCMRHDPASRRFVNTLGDGRVILEVQTDCDTFRGANVVWRAGGQQHELPMDWLGAINDQQFLTATIPAVGAFEYAFRPFACEEVRWLTPHGFEIGTAAPHNWFQYDPAQHLRFDTPAWVRDAVFYQIFPERFCNGDPHNDPAGVEPWGSRPTIKNFMGGDLQGIVSKLDYLSDLGITALYLTPIFKSASNHKYDIIDYFAVDEQFGDLALLRKLVDACHDRRIRVILDAVFNHCSNLHPFFVDVRVHGEKSRYWNWFFIKKWPFPDRIMDHQEALDAYECWWGFYTLPKLDYRNPEVEEYFLKVAHHWLREAHTDGWRLDVPNEVIQSFWPKFRRAVKEVNPEAYIVGEIWDDATSWLQGDMFDAVMNYRFQKALLHYFAEQTINTQQFDHRLRQIMLDYPEQTTAVMLNLLGSHDTARPMSVALGAASSSQDPNAPPVGGPKAPAYAQQSVKLMAAMQFTFEGAPCIYYGDEIGLQGNKDPDCRRCFPWDNPALQNQDLRAYYQKLIAIRRANPALRTGTFRPFAVDNARELYAFERRAEGNHCVVALNRSTANHIVHLPHRLHATELLTGHEFAGEQMTVPARQVVILLVHG